MPATRRNVSRLGDGAALPLLLVGCGHMGRALLRGWAGAGLPPEATIVAARDLAGRVPDQLPHRYPDVAAALDAHGRTLGSVVIAVRPSQVAGVAAALRGRLAPGVPVISVAAGATLGSMRKAVGAEPRLYRVMPNAPVSLGEGCLACAAERPDDTRGRNVVESLLAPLGQILWLRREEELDAATALSGSGPAYVYALIEAMAAGGERLGLDRLAAERLAVQTALGAARLASVSAQPPGTLCAAVASPGGTTEAALRVLLGDDGLEPLVANAMSAARQRAATFAGTRE